MLKNIRSNLKRNPPYLTVQDRDSRNTINAYENNNHPTLNKQTFNNNEKEFSFTNQKAIFRKENNDIKKEAQELISRTKKVIEGLESKREILNSRSNSFERKKLLPGFTPELIENSHSPNVFRHYQSAVKSNKTENNFSLSRSKSKSKDKSISPNHMSYNEKVSGDFEKSNLKQEINLKSMFYLFF